MAASQVTISNLALADVREPSIQSMDEDSFQARECRRQYDQCLAELLEAHEWGFAVARAALAVVANDRSGEWAYAYALPVGIGTPRRLLPNFTAAGYYSVPPYWNGIAGAVNPYIIDSGVIYSWIPDATIEYGRADVTPDEMPALFRRALGKSMAANLAKTLTDDDKLKERLQQEADLAVQRAIADDRNRQPARESVDDVAAVRGGWGLAF
jgi:hypothetical protein